MPVDRWLLNHMLLRGRLFSWASCWRILRTVFTYGLCLLRGRRITDIDVRRASGVPRTERADARLMASEILAKRRIGMTRPYRVDKDTYHAGQRDDYPHAGITQGGNQRTRDATTQAVADVVTA